MRNFTRNWTGKVIKNWSKYLLPLKDAPLQYLEIGVWEGRTTLWMMKNVLCHPASKAYCIDPWDVNNLALRKFPNNKLGKDKANMIKERFHKNLAEHEKKITVFQKQSQVALIEHYNKFKPFDIIYIDGSHHEFDVMTDSVLCYPLLKKNGIMIWDDYKIRHVGVRTAVTAFLSIFKEGEDYELLFRNSQYGIKKLREPIKQKDLRNDN